MVVAVLLGRSLAAESGAPRAQCPGYAAHLRSARASLERGDRGGALVEMHRAEQALAACIRDQGDEVGLAAREVCPTPRG